MCGHRLDKAESTLNLGVGICCEYNEVIGKRLNLTEAVVLRKKSNKGPPWQRCCRT